MPARTCMCTPFRSASPKALFWGFSSRSHLVRISIQLCPCARPQNILFTSSEQTALLKAPSAPPQSRVDRTASSPEPQLVVSAVHYCPIRQM
eukprot:5953713-Pleurochrysis_carterae.AAC.2